MIDINAYLGHFAFRQLRHNTAPELLRLMDSRKIRQAAVSSADAIAYRNVQPANEQLAAEVERHRDRLIPFAVINPTYAGWADDLATCQEKLGMKGLRLYPRWHNYKLTDAACLELVKAATKRGMLITIPVRVEDPRQRTWLVEIPDVPLAEIEGLVRAAPSAQFAILNGLGYTGSALGRKGSGLPANYSIDVGRMSAVLANELGRLVGNLGADRILFGSGMPFQYPDPAIVKVEVLEASAADKEKILTHNAARLLHL